MDRILLAGLALLAGMISPAWLAAADSAACMNGACSGGNAHGAGMGGFQQFWHRCEVDWHRNNAWPEPFLSADKMAARAPWCIMADNGWKMQNTVGTFLFDSESQRINQAGDLLVKWIVTQAPIHRRAVFVLKGDTAEITNARVRSVEAVVAKYASGCAIPVLLTDTEPAGWPASYIDSITQQFNATIPAPRLPSGGQSGGQSSGGGGGGSQ